MVRKRKFRYYLNLTLPIGVYVLLLYIILKVPTMENYTYASVYF